LRLIKVRVLQQVDCVIEIALLVQHPAGQVWGHENRAKMGAERLACVYSRLWEWWWLEMWSITGDLIGWIFGFYPQTMPTASTEGAAMSLGPE
jgi:hypothetical protein